MPSLHADSETLSFGAKEITADRYSNKSNSTECPDSLLPTGIDTMRPVEKDDRLLEHRLMFAFRPEGSSLESPGQRPGSPKLRTLKP